MAKKFLDDVELGSEAIRAAVVEFMPYSFAAVNAQSKRFLEVTKHAIRLHHGCPHPTVLCCSPAHLCTAADQGILCALVHAACGTNCTSMQSTPPAAAPPPQPAPNPYLLSAVCVTSASMLQVEKRYNYTTPKTFLELIKLYKSVLARKRNQVQEAIDRLDTVSKNTAAL